MGTHTKKTSKDHSTTLVGRPIAVVLVRVVETILCTKE